MAAHAFRRAVVATILGDASIPLRPEVEDDVQRFVGEGIAAMPPHLRLGVVGLEGLFAAETFARTGKPFAGLDPSERHERIRAWEESRLAPANQFVRLIRSLVLFAAHEGART